MQRAKNSIANAKNTGLNKLTLEQAQAARAAASQRYEDEKKRRRCGRPACLNTTCWFFITPAD